jgi:uncharacterized membrane protein
VFCIIGVVLIILLQANVEFYFENGYLRTNTSAMTQNNNRSGNGIGVGAGIGVAIGAAYGSYLGNLALSVALGLAIGVAIGAIFDFAKKRK